MSALPGQTRRSSLHHSVAAADAPHFLYRCYDADGDLIYIGCTRNVKRRIDAHLRGGRAASRWLAVFMTSHEVEGPFPNRATALAAEARAITLEQPVFNIQQRLVHNSSVTTRLIARYLVERGYQELAIATACTCWRESREAGLRDSWCDAHAGTSLEVAS